MKTLYGGKGTMNENLKRVVFASNVINSEKIGDGDIRKEAEDLKLDINDDMSDDEIAKLVEDKKKETVKNKKTYDEDEFKKVVSARDKAKEEMKKYKEKVSALEKKVEDAIDPDVVDALKKDLKILQDFKKEMDDKVEEEKLKNLDDNQRRELRFKKELEAMKEQIDSIKNVAKEAEDKVKETEESAKKRIEKLRLKTLRADIVEEASKYSVFNAAQVYKLVKDDFEYDKDMDEFYHLIRDKDGTILKELNVSEYVKNYLEDEDNENLIRSKANTNTMHTKNQANNKSNNDKLGGYKADDPDVKRLADEANMDPEKYILRVLIPRDKRKKQMKEKK